VELQRNLDATRRQGLGLAAISYDSVAVLKNFADRQHITFPLLSDPESKIIRALDILNETVAPGTAFYGIPNPGTYVIDPQGRVVSKHFEDDYRERVSATDILIQDFGMSADAAREVAETKHLRLTTSASPQWHGRVIGSRMVRKLDLVEFNDWHRAAMACSAGKPRTSDNELTTCAACSIHSRFVLIALSGWINQHQLLIIDYLREEDRVLREQLGGSRTKFNDDQRRRLAAKAKGLGRMLLSEVATIVTPETLLSWHRKLIAQKSWKEFLTQHWELIVAADFFTVEVWTRRGLQRFMVLFFIELSTRKVDIAGIGVVTNGLWMSQIGRNITDAVDGILKGKRYLIHDRDPLFTAEFLNMLADVGVQSVKLPPRSPNLNAYAERFVRTIKESCLERMILFGEESLRTAIHSFVTHYHTERNHQGLANRLINPEHEHLEDTGRVQKRQCLGGMLNYITPRGRLRSSRSIAPAVHLQAASSPVSSDAMRTCLEFYAPRFDGRRGLRLFMCCSSSSVGARKVDIAGIGDGNGLWMVVFSGLSKDQEALQLIFRTLRGRHRISARRWRVVSGR
jgi:transposase InsO family protein